MSYDIHYDISRPDIEWDAFQSIVSWLGEDTANKIFGTMRSESMTPAQARFYWSFAGVQGFPVECWINRYLED